MDDPIERSPRAISGARPKDISTYAPDAAWAPFRKLRGPPPPIDRAYLGHVLRRPFRAWVGLVCRGCAGTLERLLRQSARRLMLTRFVHEWRCESLVGERRRCVHRAFARTCLRAWRGLVGQLSALRSGDGPVLLGPTTLNKLVHAGVPPPRTTAIPAHSCSYEVPCVSCDSTPARRTSSNIITF